MKTFEEEWEEFRDLANSEFFYKFCKEYGYFNPSSPKTIANIFWDMAIKEYGNERAILELGRSLGRAEIKQIINKAIYNEYDWLGKESLEKDLDKQYGPDL